MCCCAPPPYGGETGEAVKHKKLTLITAAALAVLIIAGLFLWRYFQTPPDAGEKTVTVEVIHADGAVKDFTVKTDEAYLGGALEQEGIAQGQQSQYGLFITTVDGEAADDSLEQWWCVTKSGGRVYTGADTTPIADGDHFELTLKTGY